MKYIYMRILNWFFFLFSLAVALGLLFFSGLLFLVYIGTLPFALLLMWFVQRSARSKPESENSSDTQESPAKRELRRKFWKTLWLVFAIPLAWLVLLALTVEFGEYLPDYLGLIMGIVFLSTWVALLVGLAKISWILLLLRSMTGFPKWSLAVGGVSVLFLITCFLLPIVFFFSKRMGSPPPDAFRVFYRAKIDIGEGDTFRLKEHYEIRPQGRYTIIDIKEIESGEIPKTNMEKHEKFSGGNFENVPLEGMQVDFYRNLTLGKERLGWLRSKMTFPLPGIRLLVKDVSPRSSFPDMKNVGQPLEIFAVSKYSQVDSRIEIELPKNSFLASFPKGEFSSLPDKDIVTFSSFPDEIQVYYLQYLRLKVVRDIFSQSSNYDAFFSLLAFLFWPASMIVVGIFHQKLANRILEFVSRPFQKKQKRTIGFHP